MAGHSITAPNESEENIITSNTDISTDTTTAHDVRGIIKTTVIEQSFSIDNRTPSPKVTNPPV